MILESNELELLWVDDGSSLYTWIKYSHNSDGVDMTDNPEGMEYIGVSYNNTEKEPSNNPSDYKWSKIQGENGVDAYTIILDNEHFSFATNVNKVPIESQSVECKIIVLQGITPRTDFSIGDIEVPKGMNISVINNVITLSCSSSAVIPLICGDINVPIIIDGITISKKISYTLSMQGEKGDNAFHVYLSNENHTFEADSNGCAISTEITTNVFGFWGTSQCAVNVNYESISIPNGINIEVINNNTENTAIKISVTENLKENGILEIPCIILGQSYKCTFNYTLSKRGTDGTPAKLVTVLTNSQVLKDNNSIILTPIFQGGLNFLKWQYSLDGGNTWVDVTNGEHGLIYNGNSDNNDIYYDEEKETIIIHDNCYVENEILYVLNDSLFSEEDETLYFVSTNDYISNSLIISSSSDLFTTINTTVTFRCLSDDSQYYDTITIIKLYDNENPEDYIQIGGTNLLLNTTSMIEYDNSTHNWTIDVYNATCDVDKSTDSIHIKSLSQSDLDCGLKSTISDISFLPGNNYVFSCDVRGTYSKNYPFGAQILYTIKENVWSAASFTSWTGNINASNFKRVYFKFTIPDDFNNESKLAINILNQGIDIYIRKLKLEKGTIHTDWSPSHKDIESKVNSNISTTGGLSSLVDKLQQSITNKIWSTDIDDYDSNKGNAIRKRVSDVEQTVSGFSQRVSDMETDLDVNVDGSVTSKLNNKISEIKQNADEFQITVKKTYATRDDLNKVKVGGKNYVRGTSENWSDWYIPQPNVKDAISTFGVAILPTSKELNDEFTISFDLEWIKFNASSGKSLNIMFFGNVDDDESIINPFMQFPTLTSTLSEKDSSQHFSKTIKLETKEQASAIKYNLGIKCDYSDGTGKFRVKNLQIELGNKETGWSPAPEDVYSDIKTVQSNIDQNSKKIALLIKEDDKVTTSFSITDGLLEAITKQFKILSPDGTSTIIEGGKIKAHSISSDEITTENIEGSNGWINLSNGTFDYGEGKLKWDGVNLSVKGNIEATSGAIGGCSISNGTLIVPSANISGTLNASQISAGAITADKITTNNIAGTNGWINLRSGTFEYNDGALAWNGSTMTIGGFKISKYKIINDAIGICSTAGQEWAFWAGASSGGNAPFHVGHDGSLYASKANITGTINASSLTAKQCYKIYDSNGENERTFVSWSGDTLSFGLVSQNQVPEAYIQMSPGDTTVTFNGDIGATQGTIYADSIDATGSLSVSKTSTFKGATTFNSTLTCTSTSTFSGTATFTGSLKAGSFTFRDYSETDDNNIIFRRPVASAGSNKSRVAILQGSSNNKIIIKAQYNSTSFANATFTGSSSDIRLKRDIKDSSVNALSKIMQMQIREFNWKQTGIHQELGCVADELELIDPLLTTGGGYDKDGTMNIKSIDTLLLSEYAIKGIQELYRQNKQQQKRIEYLESQLKNK